MTKSGIGASRPLVASRRGPLTEATADAQRWPRELVFVGPRPCENTTAANH
jgi:hypothetical protein